MRYLVSNLLRNDCLCLCLISALDTGGACGQRNGSALAAQGRRVSQKDSDGRRVLRSGRKVRALRRAAWEGRFPKRRKK
jgi:hypothetical protein